MSVNKGERWALRWNRKKNWRNFQRAKDIFYERRTETMKVSYEKPSSAHSAQCTMHCTLYIFYRHCIASVLILFGGFPFSRVSYLIFFFCFFLHFAQYVVIIVACTTFINVCFLFLFRGFSKSLVLDSFFCTIKIVFFSSHYNFVHFDDLWTLTATSRSSSPFSRLDKEERNNRTALFRNIDQVFFVFILFRIPVVCLIYSRKMVRILVHR